MPRGGRRANSGRKGLTHDEKIECGAMVRELIDRDQERRYDRAVAKSARARHREGHETPLVDELKGHYAEIKRPSPEVWAQMKPEERARVFADRRDYSALHSKSPTATPIGAFFAETGMPRLISVEPPTDIELGVMYQKVADVMTVRLERPISRRQVAEAFAYSVRFARS